MHSEPSMPPSWQSLITSRQGSATRCTIGQYSPLTKRFSPASTSLTIYTWIDAHVEIFHLEFCKNILGIHRNAPNLGCRAELGRFPLLSEKRAAKFWLHLSDTPTDSYHHSAFTYRKKHPESDPLHYLVEKHQLNSTIQFKYSKMKETEKITQEEYIHDWQHKVAQLKKLTYFHSIKSDYKLAPYRSSIKNYGQRKLLTKYRLSEHSLSVETSRHKQSWRARELRLCSHCTERECVCVCERERARVCIV